MYLLDKNLCSPEDDIDNLYTDENNDNLGRRYVLYSHQERDLGLLEKRTDRKIILECPNQSPASQSFTIPNTVYISSGAWDFGNEVYDRVFDFREYYDCGDPEIRQYEVLTGRFFVSISNIFMIHQSLHQSPYAGRCMNEMAYITLYVRYFGLGSYSDWLK